mmetsp:Transcript_88271/g.274246  ORF Transcript_88271/g.274246 Transcript_88271/m.274246 type:complete len:97 (-) Transcript_88271:6-296(-)
MAATTAPTAPVSHTGQRRREVRKAFAIAREYAVATQTKKGMSMLRSSRLRSSPVLRELPQGDPGCPRAPSQVPAAQVVHRQTAAVNADSATTMAIM